jgi:hypothetical protein
MRRALATCLQSVLFASVACAAPNPSVNVVTYHGDTLRTGWNAGETVLTPANVVPSSFGLLHQVPLDEQVDAQPLYLSNQAISGHGMHNVVYVVTENNSVYAIDAASGAVLLQTNLGTPVSENVLPGGCNNNSDVVGIGSTPVIDTAAGLLYVIAYTYENNTAVYRIHALSLSTLKDAITPQVISATATYHNGKPASFDPNNQRQRSALLEANGTIYAGFASWCDIDNNVSRGWVLGWNATTLAALPTARLIDQYYKSNDSFFLSSVWMSGYGLAADAGGSIYFVTGNSDYNGRTYNPVYNLEESVVKVSPDLATVQDHFTPSGGANGWQSLDPADADLGSGGVLLLPDQPGAYTHLAVAAGKQGPMYFLNRDSLGGAGGLGKTLGGYANGGCWCGQSFYTGADGVGRVIASTGYNAVSWKLKTSATTRPILTRESTSPGFNDDQDPGFFTTISSNGTTAGSAVVWALTRPSGGNADPIGVYLQAMDPGHGLVVTYTAEAGTWPNGGNANANLVPTVANGLVYVAAYANLSIFGPTTTATAVKTAFRAPAYAQPPLYPGVKHDLHGTVVAMTGDQLTLRTRTGALVRVDYGAARGAGHVAAPKLGSAALARGDYAAGGAFVAKFLLHQKNKPSLWAADR